MKYVLEYPSELPGSSAAFLDPEVMRAVVQQAEAAGFAAVALSEHPAPSRKWRDNGGHNTLDPIAALSFMAAATGRIRLLTNLYVLPFRTPYLSAKALGSLDILSRGRLIAGVGAGYLRSEFAAVGVDHAGRGALLDEALGALRSIWSEPEKPVTGAAFGALGPLWLQAPAQRPHPPIWIGGNGRAALRRVVAHGDGWMPIIADATMAASMRTAAIENAKAFSESVTELRERLEAAGRDATAVDIQVVCPAMDFATPDTVRAARDVLGDLAERGATWAVVHTHGSDPAAADDFIREFGREFIDRP